VLFRVEVAREKEEMMGEVFSILEILYIVVSMAAWIWLTVRIWKSSGTGAVLSFFLVLPAFYFLFKYWGDKEYGIRAPFFINFGIGALAIFVAMSMPTFKSGNHLADWTSDPPVIQVRSNPEMERWCIEKNDAVYSPELGTCIEPEPGRKISHAISSIDVMDQLESHFYQNGLETRYSEVDESTPGSRGLADRPEISRVMQFEIKTKTVLPTIVTIAECETTEFCSTLAARMDKPDAPVSIASNGNLLFMGMQLMGDTEKIRQAKQAFQLFKAG
jgi:hypothetical protein